VGGGGGGGEGGGGGGGGGGLVAGCQNAKMVSVVTLIIEPNCLNSSIGTMYL
jgi:hypothetical protein